MGLLVDGVWQDKWYDTKETGGRFKRTDAKFRNWVTTDGKPGPSGEGGFPGEAGRYHLLRLARLPLGPSHADRPRTERSRGRDLRFGGRSG